MIQILHYCTFIKYLSIYSSVLPIRAHHARQTGRNNDVRRRSDYLMSLCPSLHSRGRSSLSRVFQASSPLVILSVSYLDSIQTRFKRHSAKSSPSLLVQTQSAPSDNLSCCFLSAWSGPVHRLPVSTSSTLDRKPTHTCQHLALVFIHSLTS